MESTMINKVEMETHQISDQVQKPGTKTQKIVKEKNGAHNGSSFSLVLVRYKK